MSNNLLSSFLIFATGAAIGSVVTWKLIETKYRRIADEEIESVKEHYRSKQQDDTEEESEDYENDIMVESQYDKKPDLKEYAAKIAELGYNRVSEDEIPYKKYNKPVKEVEEKKSESEDPDFIPPYVITPEEFDDPEVGYEPESLTYYEDGVLAYDNGDIVEDIETVVGKDFYKHFGEYEDDSVFIRNDWLEHDYEILKDHRCWHDIYQPDSDDENEE